PGGAPVVAPAVGGLIDTVVEGCTGDLVPARDAAALGTALRRLVNDPVRRLAYPAAGVDRARPRPAPPPPRPRAPPAPAGQRPRPAAGLLRGRRRPRPPVLHLGAFGHPT